jgi:hypothetical protein
MEYVESLGGQPPSSALTFQAISSDHQTIYDVIRHPDGFWTCTCPDFVYRSHQCKHIKRYKAKLAQDVTLIGDLL